MNSKLSNFIIEAKDGKDESLLSLLEKFEPLLRKYSYLSHYEDCKSELILCFIETVYKIPQSLLYLSDAVIVSYLRQSIVNRYININKYKNYSSNELSCEIKDWNYKMEFHSDIYFYDLLKYLNDSEKEVIILKYFSCLSDIQIGDLLGLSRQYINRLNRRALYKIKSFVA